MEHKSLADGWVWLQSEFFCFCLPTFVSFQLEIIEGTPDLGVTSYWTDADGNVVFGPSTPKEKMKTTVTGTKTQKRKGEGGSSITAWCNFAATEISIQ